MQRFRIISKMTTGLVTVAATLSLATPLALAVNSQNIPTPPKTVPAIQTAVTNRIADRMDRLIVLNNKVATMKYLTPSDHQKLQAELDGTKTGLTALGSKIKTDKTVAAATADYNKMYLDYRVYLLLSPKVSVLKINDDLKTKTITNLTISSNLISFIDPNSSDGQQMNGILTRLQTDVDKIDAIDADVMPLLPSDYNRNHQVMQASLDTLQSTKASLTSDYNLLVAMSHRVDTTQN